MSQMPYGQAGMKPDRGVVILILGILSIVACQIFGPIAWILGNSDMKEIRAGLRDPAGEQLTNVGRILGIIGTVLFILGFIFGIIWVVLFTIVAVGSTATG